MSQDLVIYLTHCQPTFSSLTVLSTSNTSDLARNQQHYQNPRMQRPIGTTAFHHDNLRGPSPEKGPNGNFSACKMWGKEFEDCLQLQLQKTLEPLEYRILYS